MSSGIDAAKASIAAFVTPIAAQQSEGDFRFPRRRPSQALSVQGEALQLYPSILPGARRGVKSFGAWPKELWPWKLRCPDTQYPSRLRFQGSAYVEFPQYDPQRSQLLEVGFEGDVGLVALYRTQVLDPAEATVKVLRLNALHVYIAFVPVMRSCGSWVLDQTQLAGDYVQVFQGNLADAADAIGTSATSVSVEMRDTSEPVPLALPSNKGALYVYIGIVMGGIWMILCVFIPLAYIFIYFNSKRNQGEPPPFYRYMRKYRGW